MNFSISEQNKVQVLEVVDLINEYDNKAILDEVDSRINSGKPNFVIDFSKLVFMNSVGINFLISMMKRSNNSGGSLALANTPKQVISLLEITKLKTMFNLQPSLEEALRMTT